MALLAPWRGYRIDGMEWISEKLIEHCLGSHISNADLTWVNMVSERTKVKGRDKVVKYMNKVCSSTLNSNMLHIAPRTV